MVIPRSFFISTTRIRKGMSMRELARRSGHNIATISNIESKSKPVTPKIAKDIVEVLEVSFDEAFEIVI